MTMNNDIHQGGEKMKKKKILSRESKVILNINLIT